MGGQMDKLNLLKNLQAKLQLKLMMDILMKTPPSDHQQNPSTAFMSSWFYG
jgi:hypothetical protein